MADLRGAAKAFDDYLTKPVGPRYVSVNSPSGPLRENDEGTCSPDRLKRIILCKMYWDDEAGVWREKGTGKPLLAAKDLFKALVVLMRDTRRRSGYQGQNTFTDAVRAAHAEVQRNDIREFQKCWLKFDLNLLDPDNDSGWSVLDQGSIQDASDSDSLPSSASNNDMVQDGQELRMKLLVQAKPSVEMPSEGSPTSHSLEDLPIHQDETPIHRDEAPISHDETPFHQEASPIHHDESPIHHRLSKIFFMLFQSLARFCNSWTKGNESG